MSEIIHDSSDDVRQSFPVTIDPSAQGLPSAMKQEYAQTINGIAYERKKYSHLQANHIEASKRDIAETAEQALRQSRQKRVERTALILGAGTCLDIPMSDILEGFDHTTVLDVDTGHTERFLSELPPKLLGKVSLIRAEVSGMARGLYDVFEKSDGSSYGRFISSAAAMVDLLDATSSPVELKNYTFVCSHLLMTQLCTTPVMWFGNAMTQRYGQTLRPEPGHSSGPLVRALLSKTAEQQQRHLRWLGELAGGEGIIHWADTLSAIKKGREYRMVSPSVSKVLQEDFAQLRDPRTWTYTAEPELAFAVESHSLAPKPKGIALRVL